VGEAFPGKFVCLAGEDMLAADVDGSGRKGRWDKTGTTYFPNANAACTVMFIIIMPFARK